MIRTLYAFLLVLALTTTPFHATQAQDLTDTQKAEIKKLFDEYLASSGQQILESVNNYQAELAEKDRQEQSKKAKAFIESLNGRENLPSTGNDKADVTIVEFFDYNCGYCRKALEEIRTVLKDDEQGESNIHRYADFRTCICRGRKMVYRCSQNGKIF